LLKLAAVAAAGCATGVDGAPAPLEDGEADVGDLPTASEASRRAVPAVLGAIDTFVVVCMEDRSFDHYLGSLRLLEGRAVAAVSTPPPAGSTAPVHALDTCTAPDPPHDWTSCHAQFDGGRNDGFVKAHAGADQDQVMAYYARSQLGVSYGLADSGVACDRWHA